MGGPVCNSLPHKRQDPFTLDSFLAILSLRLFEGRSFARITGRQRRVWPVRNQSFTSDISKLKQESGQLALELAKPSRNRSSRSNALCCSPLMIQLLEQVKCVKAETPPCHHPVTFPFRRLRRHFRVAGKPIRGHS